MDDWVKSSFCASTGACVEVWRKSSHSGADQCCVEVFRFHTSEDYQNDEWHVRDSKDPDGPVLVFDRGEWEAFIAGVKDAEFDV